MCGVGRGHLLPSAPRWAREACLQAGFGLVGIVIRSPAAFSITPVPRAIECDQLPTRAMIRPTHRRSQPHDRTTRLPSRRTTPLRLTTAGILAPTLVDEPLAFSLCFPASNCNSLLWDPVHVTLRLLSFFLVLSRSSMAIAAPSWVLARFGWAARLIWGGIAI